MLLYISSVIRLGLHLFDGEGHCSEIESDEQIYGVFDGDVLCRRQLLLLSSADLGVLKVQRGKSVDLRRRDESHT